MMYLFDLNLNTFRRAQSNIKANTLDLPSDSEPNLETVAPIVDLEKKTTFQTEEIKYNAIDK